MKKNNLQQWADFTGLYIAMDSDEYVYGYSSEPKKVASKWGGHWEGDYVMEIPFEVVSTERISWDESLRKPTQRG